MNMAPPEGCNQTVDLYIGCFRKNAQNELIKFSKKKSTTNLSLDEKLAVNAMQCNETIIIKPANKGGAIVITNEKDYIKEPERQLHDEQYYAKFTQEPSNAFKRDLKCLLSHSLKLINNR